MTVCMYNLSTVYTKQGECPALVRYRNPYGRCVAQCRGDQDCLGTKKCCNVACSLVCIEPESRVTPRKALYSRIVGQNT